MSSPNAKLLLLLMLPFSLKMFLFLEFMTGVWSFAAFLTAWIIERLMVFSLLRILPLFAFHGTRLLQIFPCFVNWRLNFSSVNLIFILQPSINTLLISFGIVLNAHYFFGSAPSFQIQTFLVKYISYICKCWVQRLRFMIFWLAIFLFYCSPLSTSHHYSFLNLLYTTLWQQKGCSIRSSKNQLHVQLFLSCCTQVSIFVYNFDYRYEGVEL